MLFRIVNLEDVGGRPVSTCWSWSPAFDRRERERYIESPVASLTTAASVRPSVRSFFSSLMRLAGLIGCENHRLLPGNQVPKAGTRHRAFP